MMQRKIKKKDFKKFFNDLRKVYKVYAPTRKGTITAYNFGDFALVDDVQWVEFKGNPISSPKKLFMPDGQTLFKYEKKDEEVTLKEGEQNWEEKRAVFAVRPCDIAAIAKLDKVFEKRSQDDPSYQQTRRNTLIIGLSCNEAVDEYCFCTVTGDGPDAETGYDLLMTDIGEEYFIRSGSPAGERLLEKKYFTEVTPEDLQARTEKVAGARKELEERNKLDLKGVDIKAILEKKFDSPMWDKYGDRCVTCGGCTMTCPSCHCFTILDKANMAQTEGKKVRIWDSCHFEKFSQMAGSSEVRPNKTSRLKHRLYDKFYYKHKQYGVSFCTGCGRCVRHCQSEIDIRTALQEVLDDEK